jgi:uncharacterized delta-60 repeat protein
MKNILFTFVLIFISTISFSQKIGSLDTTFGTSGIVKSSVGEFGNDLRSIAIQDDGKIIAVGNIDKESTFDWDYNIGIVRYNQDGIIDNTFGNSGKVITKFGESSANVSGMAIQKDEKIIIAGYLDINHSSTSFFIIRYNKNGTLDNTFGTNGIVYTEINKGNDNAADLILQSDGKIVVCGYTFISGLLNDFAIVRYNIDGTLDNSFGIRGKVITDFNNNSDDKATSIAIQSDGKILVGGLSSQDSKCYYAIVRYLTDGSLDNTFEKNGKVTTAVGDGNFDCISALLIQSDGKIIATGTSSSSTSDNDFSVVRYNSNGALDLTFGNKGKTITDIFNGSSDDLCSAAIQSNSKIVTVGWSRSNSSEDVFAIVRYNTDGTLDNNFGSTGKVISAISDSDDDASSVAIQSDGKIIVGGNYRINKTSFNFAIVRYYGEIK